MSEIGANRAAKRRAAPPPPARRGLDGDAALTRQRGQTRQPGLTRAIARWRPHAQTRQRGLTRLRVGAARSVPRRVSVTGSLAA